jgi:hypothetical protein
VARDTQEKPVEERVKDWLGSAADEFDVVFATEKVLSVDEVVQKLRKNVGSMDTPAAESIRERLMAAATRRFVYGALVIERCAGASSPKPGRISMRSGADAAGLERVLAIRRFRRQPGFESRLADTRPALAKELELRARHGVREGELVPLEFVFAADTVLPSALRVDGFVVPLIARLNGQHTPREVFDYAAANGELPEGFSFEAYLRLLAAMWEEGLVEVPPPG